MKNVNKEIKTTGQLRELLANAAQNVLDGSLDIEKATTLHKLAKNISESLYSETKIAMFSHEVGKTIPEMGNLPLGGN
jgi:K+/H+ antiporter YhaU regulatory subunit KhtT